MTLTTTYDDDAIERLIDHSVERSTKRLDHKIDQALKAMDKKIERAAERGAGIYYEKTKHDIDLVLEATGFIRERLEDMVTRDEFNELGSEVKLIRRAVTETNKDLSRFDKPGWFPGKKH